MFSFNNPMGACPECNGLGNMEIMLPELVVPDKSLSISRGAIPALRRGPRHLIMYYNLLLRKLAEQYGLCIWCFDYHHLDPKEGVQYNRAKADSLKRLAQIAFEARHSHKEWMQTFRKNYL